MEIEGIHVDVFVFVTLREGGGFVANNVVLKTESKMVETNGESMSNVRVMIIRPSARERR